MDKKEYIVSQLNLACIGLCGIRDMLISCPEMKKKVELLREEMLKEYEKEYNEWTKNN